jgi:nucleotide-binding universal stress UspA family protein
MAGLITVGVDGSERGREALRFALAEARLRDARVRAVHAWTLPPVVATGPGLVSIHNLLVTDFRGAAEQVLDAEIERVGEAATGIEIERCVVQRPAAGALVQQAVDADLLVVGSHGYGALAGFLLGSVSEACLHHARCPVAVVHVAHHADYGRIVVGVDGSSGGRDAFEWAVDEARLRGATVHAVSAYEDQWGPVVRRLANSAVLVELEATVADQAGRVVSQARSSAPDDVRVTGDAVCSDPATALIDSSSDADLLVVGSRGHGGFTSLLLGSVSRRCAAAANSVTIVVPPAKRAMPEAAAMTREAATVR